MVAAGDLFVSVCLSVCFFPLEKREEEGWSWMKEEGDRECWQEKGTWSLRQTDKHADRGRLTERQAGRQAGRQACDMMQAADRPLVTDMSQ